MLASIAYVRGRYNGHSISMKPTNLSKRLSQRVFYYGMQIVQSILLYSGKLWRSFNLAIW